MLVKGAPWSYHHPAWSQRKVSLDRFLSTFTAHGDFQTSKVQITTTKLNITVLVSGTNVQNRLDANPLLNLVKSNRGK